MIEKTKNAELYLPDIGYVIGTPDTINKLAELFGAWQQSGPRRSAEMSKQAVVPTAAMGLFPTCDSLQDVIDLGTSKLPITDKNELLTIVYTYHNTLLAQVNACK
jgi:hypothetical protein